MSQRFTPQVVLHTAQLANIPVSDQEVTALTTAFEETIAVVESMSSLDTNGVEPTHQVTGLENVWREDTVTPSTMLSQQQALANASKTADGYFVVPQVIDQS